MTHDEVLIVGGGIGGLCAAHMLGEQGLRVRVLERAPEFTEVGAGLQLAPNATRLLAQHGILEDLLPLAVRPRRLVTLSATTGEELSHLDLEDVERRYGAPYIVAHRSDLLDVLRAACERHPNVTLQPGHEVVEIVEQDDRVVAHCADGSGTTASVLLGADGLHSRTRARLVPDEPVPSGYVAYRGAVPIADVDKRLSLDDVAVYFGPGLHLVQYPVRAGRLYNQVAVFRSAEYAQGVADWGGPEELDRVFSATCEAVRVAVPSLQRNRRWPMADREPITTWVRGRVALLGDAAHPMLQYLAQGAVQAITDGAALAELLPAARRSGWDAGSVARALDEYQARRVPLATRVQSTARVWGEMWHVDGLAATLRDEAFRLRDTHDYRHVDWLYGPVADDRTRTSPTASPADAGLVTTAGETR